jgi:hypothetical protein
MTNFNAYHFCIKFKISLNSFISSSTKREVPHYPMEIEPRQRRYSRLNRKHPGGHSRNSSTLTEAEMPNIVKSSSFIENLNPETLYSPNKGSPMINNSHEDSEISNNDAVRFDVN